MISSMTGFANVAVTMLENEHEQCTVDIEIKTFNSRFFEPTCKLPGALGSYEMDITSRLKAALVRGRVYVTVRITGHGALLEKMVFSPARVQEYVDAAGYIKKNFGIEGDLTVAQIMNMPQVFAAEKTALSDEAAQRFLNGVDAAIQQTLVAREREGKSLLVDLLQRLTVISGTIERIKEIVARLIIDQKAEVALQQQRAQEGDEQAKAVLSERLSALDKMDVHEEIIRFGSHMAALTRLLGDATVEKGRKLDFTLQEMMREINTITAKCTHYEMSSAAVDVKVEIEKIREQIQNIV